jgi:hypothetical protein
MGELLKHIEPSKGGRPSETSVGAHTSFTRTDAAERAGISKHQQVQAIRVANVPAADFERQVESPKQLFLRDRCYLLSLGRFVLGNAQFL